MEDKIPSLMDRLKDNFLQKVNNIAPPSIHKSFKAF
jgi:hypothetical protein